MRQPARRRTCLPQWPRLIRPGNSMAHFTVLGANGFIGSHLVRHLGSLGHTVFAPGRNDRSLHAQPLVSVRGLYESDESVIRRPLLKS